MRVRSGAISSISTSVRGESHDDNFFKSWEASKGDQAILVGGRDFTIFDVKPFGPPTLY
jgi:hypothetical protein